VEVVGGSAMTGGCHCPVGKALRQALTVRLQRPAFRANSLTTFSLLSVGTRRRSRLPVPVTLVPRLSRRVASTKAAPEQASPTS